MSPVYFSPAPCILLAPCLLSLAPCLLYLAPMVLCILYPVGCPVSCISVPSTPSSVSLSLVPCLLYSVGALYPVFLSLEPCLLYSIRGVLSPLSCYLWPVFRSPFYPFLRARSPMFCLPSCPQRPVSYVLPSILSLEPCLLCSAFYPVPSALSPMFCLLSCP
jgi:hypothetical protein